MTTGADIQIEKGGFIRIHNAIMEKLALADLGSYEFRLLFYLIRMTYGYQRKETEISLDEWEAGTLLDRRHIVRALKNLVNRKIIHKTSTGTGRGHTTIWGLNKYIEQWLPPSKGALVEPFNEEEKGADMAPFGDDKGCQNMHVKGAKSDTSTTSPKERKKVVVVAAAAYSPPPRDERLAEFTRLHERYLGRPPANEYESDLLNDWTVRVSSDAFEHAVKEAARARVLKWSYLEPILERLEREGFSSNGTNDVVASQVDFNLEDILK